MAQNEGQRRASLAVAAWLAHHERNTAWLVRQTGADPGTIGDFLNGTRWPKYRTQGRIEKAVDWSPGTITEIADGGDPPSVDGADEAATDSLRAQIETASELDAWGRQLLLKVYDNELERQAAESADGSTDRRAG